MSAKKSTTHTLIEGELTVALRERSSIWQCRYCVDGVWQRTTTGERDLKLAKAKAKELYLEAQFRKKNNIAPITRFFKDVAKVVVKKLKEELASGNGKATYKDYISAIENYLIPILGKYKVDSIDYKVIEHLDNERIKKMNKRFSKKDKSSTLKMPTKSTLLTHNAALNRVFDEAIYRGYMVAGNKPILKAQGKKSERRVEFSIKEVKALRGNFDAWIERGRADTKDLRALLRDYVEVLLDTGARPGKELLDLRWANVEIKMYPVITKTGTFSKPDEYDDRGSEIEVVNANSTVYLTILTGKTAKHKGGRLALGYLNTLKALRRIAERNYGKNLNTVLDENKDDFIFRYKEYQSKRNNKLDKEVRFIEPTSFVKLFRTYLTEHGLLIDPVTKKERQPYSLRHTYATIRLLHDKVQPSVLIKQMGTSLAMLEKHYDHIETIKSVHQLRDDESRQLIEADMVIDKQYEYRENSKKPNKK